MSGAHSAPQKQPPPIMGPLCHCPTRLHCPMTHPFRPCIPKGLYRWGTEAPEGYVN